MSITKNQIKFVRSLSLKKNRDEHHLFVAEGKKCVTELASAFRCKMLIAIENQSDISDIVECEDLFIVPPSELERIKFFCFSSYLIFSSSNLDAAITHT